MDVIYLNSSLLTSIIGLLFAASIHAGIPLWTYSAPNPVSVTISRESTATVQYTVRNQSNKPKNLKLKKTAGLSASSCYLAKKGSTCTLTLTINGSEVPKKGIHRGPVLCEQNNANQCYQPVQGNELRIALIPEPPVTTYTVTAIGDAHVIAAPATKPVASGATGTFNLTVIPGYTAVIMSDTCGGFLSGTTYTTGVITANCSVSFGSHVLAAIYVVTGNGLTTYSPNNGENWGYLFTPSNGVFVVVTSDGTLYQATGVSGNGSPGNGAATLIYSQNGVNWNQVATALPTAGNVDWVQSLFSVGTTVYVGTGNGYVYSTSNQGSSWLPNTPAQVPDGGVVNAIVVDAGGTYYAGTSNGTVYYSADSGQSWTALVNQPSVGGGGGSILSLAIDSNGALYAITSNTTTQPEYNSSPQTSGLWQLMSTLPVAGGNATAIAASETTVYVGTDNGYVLSTSNLGLSWNGNQVPINTSAIMALTLSPVIPLSPLFVESYGILQITGSVSTSTMTVTNFSNTTATNVTANASQLPAGVTSNACASVVPGGNCILTLTAANTTNPFAPAAFDIIDSSNQIISRAALVSAVTSDSGTHYFYVYRVDGARAYVLDNNDALGSPAYWSTTTVQGQVDFTPIWGIADNSTSVAPYPDVSAGATQYLGQNNCNGIVDGACNSANILVYYNSIIVGAPVNLSYYAAGLCAQNTVGGAVPGSWYLPSACELNGGLYLDTSNNFSNCTPVLTGVFSLHSLGALGGALQGLDFKNNSYFSSTESVNNPMTYIWFAIFSPGGGGGVGGSYPKSNFINVRCVRALPF